MKRMSLFVSIILCLTLLLSMGATGVFAAEEGNENFVTNCSMTLNDEIVIKFQIGALPADAVEAVATVGSRSYAAAGDVISVPVYATQMATEITVAAVDGTGAPVASRSFTVREYLQSILGNAAYASYHALAKELLNYANAAQVHFGVNADDLAAVEGAGQTAVPGNASAYAIDDQSDLMDCTGASLVYREKIALRFYFDIDPTGCTFTVNGEAAALTVNEAGKYVEIADILPQNLDQQVVLSVTDAEGRTVSVTYSPLTYIVRMSQKGSDTTKALVKALYNYHLAAKNFVPAQDVKVSFDLGYEGETIADRTIAFGGTYGELPVPADREHYTFEGWTLADGTVVTANTKVTSTHTLYAKWEITPDTSLLKFASNGEAKSSVYREYIDGKETVVFDTAGKILDGHGYGRAVKMTLTDTSKEVIKFRFQFVSCDATAVEKLTMNYTTNVNTDINSGNYGHFVILDENHNIVVEMETGKWYTFYGRTRGYENLYLWPVTNTTEQVNVKMYFQDREVLDYEPEINIRQENTAYQGNTAPYQDKDGNWLVHYRSFTGDIDGAQQHGNTAWTRRTYIDIPSQYSYASFEFRFNVSQYAAAEEELADHIEAFAYLNAEYFDLEGNAVTAAEMKVGQWYKAIFANPIPETGDYFITMGYKNGGSGAIVNIDMDYRNAQGYAFDFDYSFTDGYYVKHSNAMVDGMEATKLTVYGGDPTVISDRRVTLNLDNAEGNVVTMKLKIAECSNTPSIQMVRTNGDRIALIVTDADGKLVDSENLEKNKWYTVTWLAKGEASYYIQTFGGQYTTGVYYLTDITVNQVETPFKAAEGNTGTFTDTFGYYAQVLTYEYEGETRYMGYARPTEDPTSSTNRQIMLTVDDKEPDVISMQIMFTDCSATPSIEIRRRDYTNVVMDYILIDEAGNLADSTNLELNKWYTLTWFGHGVKEYLIRPITGSAANGSYHIKNITVTDAFSAEYYLRAATFEFGGDTLYWGHSRANDNTGIGYRKLNLKLSTAAENVISLQMKMFKINANGTPNVRITNASGTDMALTIKDQNGAVVAATEMQLGQWYTISWISDGSSTYNLLSFDGNGVAGDYLLKNIEVHSAPALKFNARKANALSTYASIGEDGVEYTYKATTTLTAAAETNTMSISLPAGNRGMHFQIRFNDVTMDNGGNGVNVIAHCFSNNGVINAIWYDENGQVATTKETGKWYTVVIYGENSSDKGFWMYLATTSGAGVTSLDVTIKNVEVNNSVLTTDANATLTVNNDAGDLAYIYRTKATNVADNRKLQFRNAGGMTTLTYKIKFNKSQWSGAEGDLCYFRHMSGSSWLYPTLTDENGNVVEQANRQVGVWYTATLTVPEGLAKTVYGFTYGTGSQNDVDVELEIKDIQFS